MLARSLSIRLSAVGLIALAACGVVSLPGCAHGDDLGQRAAQAARSGDLAGFDALMREAAERRARGRLSAPERTVFTHFLELAGSPGFEAALERWREAGWVPNDQTCSIERARFRGLRRREPEAARAAARRAVALARRSAGVPAESWVLKACLQGADFLEAPLAELGPWLELIGDPSEPAALRQAVLQGMTRRFLQDPARRRQAEPPPPMEAACRAAREQLEAARARFVAIVEAAELAGDLPTLVRGAAFGALELERAENALGGSFFAGFAGPTEAADRARLVDGWIAHAREGPRIARLEPLGLWRRPGGEPGGAAHRWYACRSGDPFVAPEALDAEALAARCPDGVEAGPTRLRASLEARRGPGACHFPAPLGTSGP